MQTTALQMRLRYPGEDEAQFTESVPARRRRPALVPAATVAGHRPGKPTDQGNNQTTSGGARERPMTEGHSEMNRKGKGTDGGAGGESVRCYYVRVTLVGADGTERRGTVEVDGRLLRSLADHEGSARAARSWVRLLVGRMCRQHPQDLGLGSARWKTATGLSMKAYVEKAIRRRTKGGSTAPSGDDETITADTGTAPNKGEVSA